MDPSKVTSRLGPALALIRRYLDMPQFMRGQIDDLLKQPYTDARVDDIPRRLQAYFKARGYYNANVSATGDPLPWSEWAREFYETMPDELRSYVESKMQAGGKSDRDYLVAQIFSPAIEPHLPAIFDALEETLGPKAIYAQSRQRSQTGDGKPAPAKALRSSS